MRSSSSACERLGKPVATPRADQRHDVLAARKHPRDRQLRDGRTLVRRRCARSASTSARLRSRFSPGKRGASARKSFGARARSLRPVAAEQAPRQHAVGRHADAELPAGRAGCRPRCRARRASTRSADRRLGAPRARGGSCPRRPPRGRRNGRSRPHHVGDRADRLLDRARRDRADRDGRGRRDRCRAA